MAAISKKDKLIEEAQKFVGRGQLEKAVRAYEQILELDPAAINLRQKRAELLVKCGRNEDARKEHELIGKHFTKNGFYLKAIAVYKQLQKLFPADISLSMTLAELNEKHGLVANALSEYKIVSAFHEKAGNIPALLTILERMQMVDPQNIAIKIKLAEAYSQHGKRDESYTVFAKVVAMLLERSDNTTLAKICGRIRELFPERPDFMFAILSEQISQGNATAAITGIQNLLRTNPDNKQAWDLVVRAYELLEQPQRVKVACQHYLKFFPAEPAAMHGLIAAVTAERNLAEAFELLDKYESALIAAGYLSQLEQTYHSLDKLDPINVRVTEGLIRVATAAGNKEEARALTSKLKSLRSVSSGMQKKESPPAETVPAPPQDSHTEQKSAFGGQIYANKNASESTTIRGVTTPNAVSFTEKTTGSVQQADEEIEIDIEIDTEPSFSSEDQNAKSSSSRESWLDSAVTLFDAVDAAPRAVKFGNELEDSDAQAHFDLGRAFKEMGLFDEAIKEFRQASHDPTRRVECQVLQCACLRERGELEKSISMLKSLLKPGLSQDAGCIVKYELAAGYEAAGKSEEAHLLFSEIFATNPDFRDIRSRILEPGSESLVFSDDDLKDF
jgi:tetratricopeptide (TPR) repeat protein